MRGYPRSFTQWLGLVLLLLFVSGCLLTPTFLMVRMDVDVAWRLSGTDRLAAVVLHTGAGFVLLACLGAIAAIHVRVGWRHGGNTASGITMLLLFALLTLTALAIFYLGSDYAAFLAALAHLLCGAGLLPLLLYHWGRGRRLALLRHGRAGKIAASR